jgi:hypothetical protein
LLLKGLRQNSGTESRWMARYVGHCGRQLYPPFVHILAHLSVRSFSVYSAILYIPDNPLPFLTRNLPSFRGFLTVRNRFLVEMHLKRHLLLYVSQIFFCVDLS